MNVLVLNDLDRDDACYWIRLGFYLERLKSDGFAGRLFLNALECYDEADLIIVQRHVDLSEFLIQKMLASPKPVLFETDDCLLELPEEHVVYEHYLARAFVSWEFIRRFTAAICVSTPPLETYFGRYSREIRIIKNTLPHPASPDAFSGLRNGGPVRIGYVGSGTHRGDYRFLTDTLARVRDFYAGEIEFHFFGFAPDGFSGPQVHTYPFATDYISHTERVRGMGLDICLAPLTDTSFNRAKSTMKYVEYTHFGAVGLYSDVEPYRGIRGGIVLKNDPRAWFDALCALIDSKDLRAGLHRSAVEQVNAEFHFETELERFRDSLTNAMRNPRAPRAETLMTEMEHSCSAPGSHRDARWMEFMDRFAGRAAALYPEPEGLRRRLSRVRPRNLSDSLQLAILQARHGMDVGACRLLLEVVEELLRLEPPALSSERMTASRVLAACRAVLGGVTAAADPPPAGLPKTPRPQDGGFLGELASLANPVIQHCRTAGVRRVAFYGAGSHTASLLPLWIGSGGPPVSTVIVTTEAGESEILGIPILAAERFDPASVDAVILSSQCNEQAMWNTCKAMWPALPVHPIWQARDTASLDRMLREQLECCREQLRLNIRLPQLVTRAAAECAKRKFRRIGLYGAGAHSRRVLQLWGNGPAQITSIVVTQKTQADAWEGLPVCGLADGRIEELDAILLSSRSYEKEMYFQAKRWHPEIPVISLWNDRRTLDRYRDVRARYIPALLEHCARLNPERVVFVGGLDATDDCLAAWLAAAGPGSASRILIDTCGSVLLRTPQIAPPGPADVVVVCSRHKERELYALVKDQVPDARCLGLRTSTAELESYWKTLELVKAPVANARNMRRVALYWSGCGTADIRRAWVQCEGPEIGAILLPDGPSGTMYGRVAGAVAASGFDFSAVDGVIIDQASYQRDQLQCQKFDAHPARMLVAGDSAPLNEEAQWAYRNSLTPKMARHFRETWPRFERKPRFSFVMPVYNTRPDFLAQALDSICEQIYPRWEACIADDHSTDPQVVRLLKAYAEAEPRIRLVRIPRRSGISGASNAALPRVRGDYVIPVDHDDILEPDALFQIAQFFENRGPAELLYTDSCRIGPDGAILHSMFKPDWSADLMRSYCYVNHLKVFHRPLIEKAGPFDSSYDCSQDYDLFLRCSELARSVEHLPLVLYRHRVSPGQHSRSTASQYNGRKAVSSHLRRLGIAEDISVVQPDFAARAGDGLYELRPAREVRQKVSVVIRGSEDPGELLACAESLAVGASRHECEYIVLSPSGAVLPARSRAAERMTILPAAEGESELAALNRAASAASGEFLVFMDDSLRACGDEWLDSLLVYGRLDGVGAVGPRILTRDGAVAEAGLVLTAEGEAARPFQGLDAEAQGYSHYAAVARNCSAIGRRGMLVRRDVFLEAGGFDPAPGRDGLPQIRFCGRLTSSGRRIVWTPFATLHEVKASPRQGANGRRAGGASQDPWYSLNLAVESDRLYRPATNRNNRMLCLSPGRSLKVLSVSHDLNWEGVPKSKLAIDLALEESGSEVHVLSAVAGPLADVYLERGIPLDYADTVDWNVIPDRYAALVDAVRRKITAEQYAVVYANTLTTFWAIQAAHAANVPSIWNIRESVDYVRYFASLVPEPWINAQALSSFEKANRAVFACCATARLFGRYDTFGTSTVIYNGIDLGAIGKWMQSGKDEVRRMLGLSRGKLIVCTIGTVSARKGQADLVRCAVEILQSREDVDFLLVGAKEDPLLAGVLSEIRSLIGSRESAIRLVPLVPDALPYYRASDIYVCASYEESFLRSILEVMAFGLPIAATPIFGIAEQITDGETGLFFDPADTAGMRRQLERLLDDPTLRGGLGARAQEAVRARFRQEEMVEQFRRLFQVVAFECTNAEEQGKWKVRGRL